MDACKIKFVPKLIKQMNEKSARSSRKYIDNIKIMLKNETSKEKKKELKNKKKFWEDLLKIQNQNIKNPTKKRITETSKLFCNPGCVGTPMQEAEYSDKELEKMYEWAGDNKASLIKEMKKTRKKLRKGRKTILKDNFYHKFDAKTKKQIIKEGALSGCTVGL
jgi:hypothetical protein